MRIIPAIYPECFEEVADKVYALSGITAFVQIIISDGSYGMRQSWDPSGILPVSFDYEFDLALFSWREYLAKVYSMSAKSAIVHIDTFTDEDFADLTKIVSSYRKAVGVCIANDTDIEVLIKAIRKLEAMQIVNEAEKLFIQVTGVKNETGGDRLFDGRVLKRITVLKEIFPNHPIQVSGRITPDTAGQVKAAGADRLVSSSYIFGQENIEQAITDLMIAAERAPEHSSALTEVASVPQPRTGIVQTFLNKAEALVFTKQPKVKRVAGKKYDASTDEIVYENDDVFSRE